MNTTYRGIITLVKSAVTGEKLALPEGFSLEQADELICKHSLLPLAYQGAYNCGIPKDLQIMQRYQAQYFRALIRSEQQLQAIERLFRAFEENGIDYLPVKGCNMKKLYPKPELRIMGDADVLIRMEQYDRIRSIVQQLGYEEGKVSDQELCWHSPGLYLELHKKLFGRGYDQSDLRRYFGEGWDRAVKEKGFRYCLRAEDEYVYIFSHMTKHFRFGGIGARQIVDLYVYRRAHPEMDEAWIAREISNLHLEEFYNNIQRLLSVWFADAPEDPVTDMITEFIFRSGNWGTKENVYYSKELVKAPKADGIRISKWRSIVKAAFPPLRELQMKYCILYKYPVLCPVFWVVRWFDVLLHTPKNIGRRLGVVREMTDEKVAAYRQAMNYMGLDYSYEEEKE